VLGLRSLLLIDLGDPASPIVVADVRLRPTDDGLILSSAGRCGRDDAALDEWWDSASPCGASGRDVAAYAGGNLFLNLLGSVYVLNFKLDGAPAVSNGVTTGLVRDMRAEGGYLYANTAWGDGVVLAQGDDGDWSVAGSHDAQNWVEGTVEAGGFVLHAGSGVLQVAERP
jgi:hypothetical protein